MKYLKLLRKENTLSTAAEEGLEALKATVHTIIASKGSP